MHVTWQQTVWSLFDAAEQKQIEKIREIVATQGRHPLVILLYSEPNSEFARQQLANLVTGIEEIRRRNPNWSLDSALKKRLLDPSIDTCRSALAELQVYAYLINAFPDTRPIRTQKHKTPDFEVNHHLNVPSKPVYVEVHSKGWSEQMEKRMMQLQEDFDAGKIGGKGPIRTAVMVITPFAGANPASQIEDGVSKLCSIGSKSCQFPSDHAGVLWLNLEQHALNMILTPDDCHPLYSIGTAKMCSGKLWNALYGEKELPLYEVYPDRPVYTMRHAGMFADRRISAVAANFSREIVLFENPNAEVVLPTWFREQFFNMKWFRYQLSRVHMPKVDLISRIEMEVAQCRALKSVDIFQNW
jgi:hypothetical protein